MSDRMRSDYKKYMEGTAPSDEFLKRLPQVLSKEQDKCTKAGMRHIRRIRRLGALAACIVVLLGISGVLFYKGYFSSKQPAPNGIGSYTGSVGAENGPADDAIAYEQGGWYDDNLTGMSTPRALAQKISSSLEYLAFGDENYFVGAEHADADKVGEIILWLEEAAEDDRPADGTTVYYMAVFTDGSVAKFSVTGESLIEIAGDDTRYYR